MPQWLLEGAWQPPEVNVLVGLQTWTETNLPCGFQVGCGLEEVVLTPVQLSATLNLN